MATTTTTDDLQIGKILLQNELISMEELKECIDLQGRVKAVGGTILLGEVLLQKGYLDEKTLRGALAVQREKMQIALALHPLRERGLTPEVDLSIGRLAIANGLIQQAQLDEALEIQKKVRALGVEKRIGEILVDRRMVSREALEGLLSVQERKKKKATEVELAAVGLAPPPGGEAKVLDGVPDAFVLRVLREERILSESLIAECLDVQRKVAGMGIARGLGGILLSKGYLTVDQARTLATRYASPAAQVEAPESRGMRLTPRDAVLGGILIVIILYAIFHDPKDKGEPKPAAGGPTAPVAVGGPAVQPGPAVAPPSMGGGGETLAGVPAEELDRRCEALIRDGALAAFGAMCEVRSVTRAAADGKAYGPREDFRVADFTAWFEAWEGRTLGISRRDPALRGRMEGKPHGRLLRALDDAVRAAHGYGLALRSDVASHMRFSAPPGPADTSDSLRGKALTLLESLAEECGFDLPEEETEGE